MSLNESLSPELEAQAQELAARIRADADILALTRLLVAKPDAARSRRPPNNWSAWPGA